MPPFALLSSTGVLLLKSTHVLGVVVFLGAGLMSAWYKVRGDRSRDPAVLAWCQREIVRADWFFTVPSGVIVPITGFWLVYEYGIPWTTPWIHFGIGGYVIAGLLWLPAAALQIRMRALAETAAQRGTAVGAAFHRANRIWFLLGVGAFSAAIGTVWVMVAKWSL